MDIELGNIFNRGQKLFWGIETEHLGKPMIY
jgi:hypothetical protein